MSLHVSTAQARRLLVHYQLQRSDLAGILARLGTIQYDPLNPVGRNPDIVLQARVEGYHVDDWQIAAYQNRLMYDAWDKQACLVPVEQWAKRAPIRSEYLAWHDRTVLQDQPGAVKATLEAIDKRGPLCSLDFEDRSRAREANSWLGPTLVKRILRALWIRGELVTHHREAGRHYYDRPERVIPQQYLDESTPSMEEFHRWIVLQRHRAVGLLRQSAEAAIWSACGDAATRSRAIHELVDSGSLITVRVDRATTAFHMLPSLAAYLDKPLEMPRAVVLAPLDTLLWDRRMIDLLFDFKYVWEVYKPEPARMWGYYVLPVIYGDRFVARLDSRLDGNVWRINRWWWEDGVNVDADLLEAARRALADFRDYLGAEGIACSAAVDTHLRSISRELSDGPPPDGGTSYDA